MLMLLVAGILCASSAHAAVSLTVPSTAEYGDSLRVQGSVSSNSQMVNITIENPSGDVVFRQTSIPVYAGYTFDRTFTLNNANTINGTNAPYLLPGTYTVRVVGSDTTYDLEVTDTFALSSAIALDAASKRVGETLTVTGGAFAASTAASVTIAGTGTDNSLVVINKQLSATEVGPDGAFSLNVLLSNTETQNLVYVKAGPYTVTATGISLGKTFEVQNSAPSIGSTPARFHDEYRTSVGATWVYTLSASDANNDTLNYGYTASPAMAGFSRTGNVFTFVPQTTGTMNLHFTVTDTPGSGVSGATATQDITLKVYEAEYDQQLVINEEPDAQTDLKPGEIMDMDVEIKNNIRDSLGQELDAEDITITIEIDDLDVEVEEEDIDLDYGDSEKFNFEIEVPLDAESGTYDIVVTVEGDDEEGDLHKDEWTIEFDVERDDHELFISDLAVTPSSVSCGGKIDLSATVYNVGNKNEDDVYLRIRNTELDIDVNTETVDKLYETGSGQHESFRKLLILPTDVDEGTYYIMVEAISEDTSTEDVVELFVSCGEGSSSRDSSDSDDGLSMDAGDYVSSSSVILRLGQTGKLQTVLSNTESGVKSYSLQLLGINSWAVGSVEPSVLTLGPNSAAPVYVYLTPKTTASASETATLAVYSGNRLVSTQNFDVAVEGAASADTVEINDYGHSAVIGGSVSTMDAVSTIMLIASLVVLGFVLYLVKSQNVKAGPGRPKKN